MSSLSDFPPRLHASTTHREVIYTRSKAHYAIHQASEAQAKRAVMKLEADDGTIAVLAAKPNAAEGKTSAVYESEGGALLVPTGQVFIRFEEGTPVEERRAAIEKIGYVIVQPLPYAPHAAWLRHKDDDVAAALSNIGALERLPGVENVEPQFISTRALR